MKNIILVIALVSALVVPALLFGSGSVLNLVEISNSSGASAVNVQDGGNSFTVDNAALSATGNGTSSGSLRVTVASDTSGVLSVDDNGTTLSVDDGAGVISVDDAGTTISIDDGGSSISINGTVTPTDAFGNPVDTHNTNTLNSEFNGTTWDRTRHSYSQNTTGVTTNAAGTTVDMEDTPMSKFTLLVDRTAGATDVVEIDLECSLNNTAFVEIATIVTLVAEPFLINPVETVPCEFMRYNVVDVGAGNTLAIDLLATR